MEQGRMVRNKPTISDKGDNNYNGEKTIYSISTVRKIEQLHVKE